MLQMLRAPLKLMPVFLCALAVNAAPLEQKTAPLDELLEYALVGITNRGLVQCLADKGNIKYFFLATAYSGHRQASNSPLLYMPWRLLQSVDTNETYRLMAAGSYAEFTKSVSTGKPKGKYGMPGSGFPRGSTNWLSSIDVQLWANKELGECDNIYHLHPDGDGTNYVVLISKAGRKWIILERDHKLSYTGYFDRGDHLYIFGGKDDPDRPPVPDAPRPMVFDEVSKFEDFYGATKAIDTELGKFRIWRKGDFIVSHIDGTPTRRVVTVEKVIGGDFNEREVFEIADRYCGKLEWSLEEKDDK